MFTKLAVTASLLLAASAFTASADTPPAPSDAGDVAGVTVRADDLNLRTEAGAQVLMRRIRHAAMLVCGGPPEIRMAGATAKYRDCVTGSVNRAALEVVLAARRPTSRITVLAAAAR